MRRRGWAAGITALLGLLVVVQGVLAASASGAPQAAPAKNGNNGTIKIGTATIDSNDQKNSNNHPHVGCEFHVQWFGFDANVAKPVTVTFNAQPPSGDKSVVVTPLIGPSSFSFFTSAADKLYRLDTSGLTEHPIQGYHVKVTVHVGWSNGNDKKSKVFWTQSCVDPGASQSASSSASASESASASSSASASESASASQSASQSASESASASQSASQSASESVSQTPSVQGSSLSTSPSISPTVLGVKITRNPTSGGGLPFTGGLLPPFATVVLGLGLLTLGVLLAFGSRTHGAHQR
jgi:hypothetical protein